MRIGISNLKGGVGKTTLSQNLAVCFAHMGYKTAIADTDANQNSLEWFGARDESLPKIFVSGTTEPKALNKGVDALHEDYEIVIIDGTPSLNEMTTRIILASDILLIPILPSGHDYRAMKQFFDRYEQAKEFRDKIPAYFILNQFTAAINIHQDIRNILNEYAAKHGVGIFETTINKRVSYVKAGIEGKGVFELDDDKATQEMVGLTREVLGVAQSQGLIHG
jgi:chromosome partitioning protein